MDWTSNRMIAVYIVAAVMWVRGSESIITAEVVGGIWFTVLFVNFLVEEYQVSVKILAIALLCVGVLFLWLNLLGWVIKGKAKRLEEIRGSLVIDTRSG